MFLIKVGFVGLACVGVARLLGQLTILWPMLWNLMPESARQASQSEVWFLAVGMIAQTAAIVLAPLAVAFIALDRRWRIANIVVPAGLLAAAIYHLPAIFIFVFNARPVLEMSKGPFGRFVVAGLLLNFLVVVFCAIALAGFIARSRKPSASKL